MAQDTFKALLLQQEESQVRANFTRLDRNALPGGEVLVQVTYAGLNYKDGLAIAGKGKVVRNFPMTPGIDFVGKVLESASPEFRPDDRVILTGRGAGENHWGGYAELARVNADWLVPLPPELSPRQAGGIGTAGVTAMMCVMALEAHGCRPEHGPLLVTGASGGVGGMAITILAHLGYTVTASTGRTHLAGYLKSLGAGEVMDRQELAGPPDRPLGPRRWTGAVDTVGGDTLATLLTMIQDEGSVTAVGLAGGHQLNTTVYPFILRGIKLLGINAADVPKTRQLEIWSRLVSDAPLDILDQIIRVEPLSNVLDLAEEILAGQIQGRVVLDVSR